VFLFQRFSQCSSAHLHILLSFCWWKREEEEEEEEEVCNQEFCLFVGMCATIPLQLILKQSVYYFHKSLYVKQLNVSVLFATRSILLNPSRIVSSRFPRSIFCTRKKFHLGFLLSSSSSSAAAAATGAAVTAFKALEVKNNYTTTATSACEFDNQHQKMPPKRKEMTASHQGSNNNKEQKAKKKLSNDVDDNHALPDISFERPPLSRGVHPGKLFKP
jgi:hypothetical protein